MISCQNSHTLVKVKWPGLSTYMTSLHSWRMQMCSMSRGQFAAFTHTSRIPGTMVPQTASRLHELT